MDVIIFLVLAVIVGVGWLSRERIGDAIGNKLDAHHARKYYSNSRSHLMWSKGIDTQHHTISAQQRETATSWHHGEHIEGHWEPQVARAEKKARRATKREQRSNPTTLLGARRHKKAVKARETVNALSSNRDRELRQHSMVVDGLKKGRPLQGSPGINMGTGDNRHGIGREGHGTRSMPKAGTPFRISKKGQVTPASSNNKMADMLRRKKK